ncbi:MAG: hypothetical protein SFT94_00875 [Pseudanabaenaceae cyanobacterium bins.68]|nr:hypothetical protein [Pseudanabaenaceae cyanobacterium bins.68]
MLNWEFLLQKQGDKSWLPLEPRGAVVTAEILEGYYRVAARSRLSNQSITIDTCHISPGGGLAESTQSQRQVNEQGLVMVMTYRLLTPGTWQINCRQTHTVLPKLQLEVLTVEDQVPVPDAPAPRQVLLRLDQLQFTLAEHAPLELMGEAEILGELEVTLNDPQTMRTVIKQKFILEGDVYPYQFCHSLTLPHHSGVLVGTVQLILPPNLDYDLGNYLSYQAISVTCLPAVATQMPDPLDPGADYDHSDGFFTKLQQILPAQPHLEQLYQEIDQLLTAPMPELLPPPALNPLPPIVSQLPVHQDLPSPSIAIATEVVAGYPCKLTMSYKGSTKLAVRLWIKDTQTRQIIDGPRWLWDLEQVADRYTADTLITLPLGILEATFEAVTVEVDSQRQSHKTKYNCEVLPPNLEKPDLSWLELGFESVAQK